MNRYYFACLVIIIFTSCMDKTIIDENLNPMEDEIELAYKYKIQVTSSGDYTNYNSAITIYSYGDSVLINKNEKQRYLFQYPLDAQSKNTFRFINTDSISLRLILGADKNMDAHSGQATINLKVYDQTSLIEESDYKLNPQDIRSVIYMDYFN